MTALTALAVLTLVCANFPAQVMAADPGDSTGKDETRSPWRSNLSERPDGPMTPAQALRLRFSDPSNRVSRKTGDPVIAGTVLVLRAITEFNARERSILVDDAVRHLRKNPDSDPAIWRVVETYKRNNPHLSDQVDQVRTAIADRLAGGEPEEKGWFEY